VMDKKLPLRYPKPLMQIAKLDIAQQPAANDALIAKLSGRLSLETVNGFLQETRGLATAKLVLDMNGVTFLDSAGVGALVTLFVHRRNNAQKMALAALTVQGAAVLQVAGLNKLLPIFGSVEQALAG